MVGLIELKAFMQAQQLASLADLVKAFGAEPNLLRDMLARWVDKGKVRCVQKTANCGTKCMRCDPLITELYEWIG